MTQTDIRQQESLPRDLNSKVDFDASLPTGKTRIMSIFALIVRVAARNLVLYRFRTIIIAGLIAFGSALATFGTSILRDIEDSMRRSITESISGDLQVYSDKAKDDLSIFGSGFMGRADIGSMPDFSQVKAATLKHENVAAFVPMGLDMAIISRGNEMDDAVTALRKGLISGDSAIIQECKDRVRFQIEQLKTELDMRLKVSRENSDILTQQSDIKKVLEGKFLDDLKVGDELSLQFLETKIAPISGQKQPVYLAYFATDTKSYRQNFPKFKVTEGQELPPGERGMMLGKKVREEMLKNGVARIFDKLNKKVIVGGATIASDEDALRDSRELVRQYDQIMSYLDKTKAEELSHQLAQIGIGIKDSVNGTKINFIEGLTNQIKEFLVVNDVNLKQRRDWFYQNIAPKIRLYEISPGETVVLKSYTRSGYIKALPVKVYGVFGFEGLESSDLAGGLSMIDLVTFRELYGQMTEASQKELAEMRAQVKVKDIGRSQAEDELFGDQAKVQEVTMPAAPQPSPEQPSSSTQLIKIAPTLLNQFTQQEVEQGLALNAAIKLKDPSKTAATLRELEQLYKNSGLNIKVVDWQKASGLVGQFVNIIRGVLFFAIFIIFLVALVIINNSIVSSTFSRSKEIGTMRAIGAQKSFVLWMILVESALTGLVGAFVGSLLSFLVVFFAESRGINAGNDFMAFLFAGPKLYPRMHWDIFCSAPLIVGVIATMASLYAASHAARISPIEAMQERE